MAPPYTLEAVGDIPALEQALAMPGTALACLEAYPRVKIEVRTEEAIRLPVHDARGFSVGKPLDRGVRR